MIAFCVACANFDRNRARDRQSDRGCGFVGSGLMGANVRWRSERQCSKEQEYYARHSGVHWKWKQRQMLKGW